MINIYAIGFRFASVCAPVKMTAQQVAEAANQIASPGDGLVWKPSAAKKFDDGYKIPNPCYITPNRRHWLLELKDNDNG